MALSWSNSFDVQCFLDHNNYPDSKEKVVDAILAIGARESFEYQENGKLDGFDQLEQWLNQSKDWAFGFFSYDLKNELENLTTSSADFHSFPKIHFFRPESILLFNESEVTILSSSMEPTEIYETIQKIEIPTPQLPRRIHVNPNFTKEEYLSSVRQIKKHIALGDIYEMNFCQSFFAEQIQLDPLAAFHALNELSEAPFATYYKLNEQYLLCGSPERFLKKQGQRLLSQPIKGTRPRMTSNALDELAINELQYSAKDRSENVMIVDLVRNDLARSCKPGSIQVEELFGVYTFKAVHQMISSISGELRPEISGLEAIRRAFPMGSMTGAPKIRAMQLIDRFERNARGLYSGSVGYFTPDGDFDFNVVIRSILYESPSKRLSFQVGGAIVADSDPQAEYEECLVKAKTMIEVLGLKKLLLDAN